MKLARPPPGAALEHNLLFRVELDGVTPLGVHIAKEAVLPAREWEESHRRSHANVDANVPGSCFITELACRGPTACEQTGHVAVGGGVYQVDCFIDRLYVLEAEYRPEDLDTGNVAARIDVIQDRRADEVAMLVAGDRLATPIDKYLGSLAHALADQRLDALLALSRDHRPHLDFRVQPEANLAPRRHVADPFPERSAGLANRDRDRCRQAALSRAPERRYGIDGEGYIHFGVRQDNHLGL